MQENNNNKQEPTISGNASSSGPTNSTPEVKEELSKVASNPKRNILVMASMILGMVVMVYNLLSSILSSYKQPTENTVSVPQPQNISTPSNIVADLPPVPQIPEPPKLIAPTPPPPPSNPSKENMDQAAPLPVNPILPQVLTPSVEPSTINTNSKPPTVNSKKLIDDSSAKQRQEAKRKSSIILVGGSASKETSAIEKEQATDFKKRGDLEYVLGQGKIIDAVVESAINSDFAGEIRAVVSRDVYSENAKTILIPKGSRIFGTFEADPSTGRVNVSWTKINLESGYTLTMAAIGVDNLGRPGVHGRVDNKYKEQMTNALLTSAFNVAVASGLDKVIPPVTSTATAAQTSSGVNAVISQATTIVADPNNQTPPNYAIATINGAPDNGAGAKINAICALQSQITDSTSSAYTSLTTACTTAKATIGTVNVQGGLNTLLSAITGLASTSAAAAVTNATPTQTQQASKQAFTDITTAAQNMMEKVQFQPTVTIDQGTKIKIYVNKDYVFPKDSVNQTKVIH